MNQVNGCSKLITFELAHTIFTLYFSGVYRMENYVVAFMIAAILGMFLIVGLTAFVCKVCAACSSCCSCCETEYVSTPDSLHQLLAIAVDLFNNNLVLFQ